MSKRTKEELQLLQALPLEVKIKKTQQRIREWVGHFGIDGVYVSFSGGKDSLALLHIARQMYPEIKAMHVNTSLEFPEIEKFVRTFDNVDIIKPKMTFVEVVKKYGYPMISKEVAECVYGARKYLTSVIEANEILETDRQTDRQTDRPYRYRFERLCEIGEWARSQSILTDSNGTNSWQQESMGGGATTSTVNSRNLMQESGIRQSRCGRNLTNLYTENRSHSETQSSMESAVTVDSTFLRTLLKANANQTIDNLRVQRLMGINRKDGKATAETIPSMIDKSAYSCKRYQFFLDAPFEIGQQCCGVMKKNPAHKYNKDTGRKPMTAQMASESRLRTQAWIKSGCNGFDLKNPISNPMSFWFDQDVLMYLKLNGIKPCEVYGDIASDDEITGQMSIQDFLKMEIFDLDRPTLETTGCKRTGCFACGFGLHHETTAEKSRLQNIVKYSNPKMLDWMLRGGHFRETDGMWEPNQGLGMAFVYEWINRHGNFNIWYPDKEKYLSQLPDECWRYLE